MKKNSNFFISAKLEMGNFLKIIGLRIFNHKILHELDLKKSF